MKQADSNVTKASISDDLLALANNFQINGPDDDGLVWLCLPGNGTTGSAIFNLGTASRISVQVALHLESDRQSAIAKATKGCQRQRH